MTFLGISSGAGSGIYSSIGGTIQTLVDRNTLVPGGTGLFSGVANVYRAGSSVAFAGIQSGLFLGFYRWTPSGINPIVTLSTPIPNGTGNFTNWGWQSLSGDRLAFSARNATTRGVYSRDAAGASPVSVIADTTMIVPGTTLPWAGFTVVSADGPNTAFAGGPTNLGGVWAHLNGQLIRLAETGMTGPNGEQFQLFEQVSMSGSNVAFLVNTNVGRQIYVWRNGDLSRVVKYGDVINGVQVWDLTLTSQSLRGDTVAFTFNTPTGAGPVFGGVYTATYIPVPATSAVLLAGIAFRRRRITGRGPRSRAINVRFEVR